MTPIQEARETLERASRDVLEIQIPSRDHRYDLAEAIRTMFHATARFVLLVHQNLHLARVAAEAEAAYESEETAWAKRLHAALVRLQDLRQRIGSAFPGTGSTIASRTEAEQDNPQFDALVEKLLATRPKNDWSQSDGKSLCRILREHLIAAEPSDKDGVAATIMQEVEKCAEEMSHVKRGQRLLRESSPGLYWQWLVDVQCGANPVPGTRDAKVADAQTWRGILGPIFALLHTSPNLASVDLPKLPPFAAKLKTRLRAIVTDFHARLGRRATVGAVLERYARRCRSLRLREMRALLAQKTSQRNQERVLTQDAALFMFDQGFEVMTEQSIGSHRYDLKGDTILVEAKVYDARRPALAAMVQGLNQLHQYANALSDEGSQLEPVLLLFRLGGPLGTRVEEYRHGNLRVAIAHVDLGESVDSGRKSPPPDPHITPEAISAELAREATRLAGKTKKRRRDG
jgi:hypothetical protein